MTTTVETNSNELQYDPNRLLDELRQRLNLTTDAALSRVLEVAPPVVSKIRNKRLPVGASLLIRMHEVTDISIRDLRSLMGDKRKNWKTTVRENQQRRKGDK